MNEAVGIGWKGIDCSTGELVACNISVVFFPTCAVVLALPCLAFFALGGVERRCGLVRSRSRVPALGDLAI
jgi:hypothetical protein